MVISLPMSTLRTVYLHANIKDDTSGGKSLKFIFLAMHLVLLKVLGLRIMLMNIIITVIVIIIAVELIEHIIFPIVWYILKGRKKSKYGVISMIGNVVEIRRWNNTEGQVLINGELWSAECETPLPVGGKAVVHGIEGITLKLKPYENS
jgi:membrane-bound ClpP family serine protease